jgi:hypothetical protein
MNGLPEDNPTAGLRQFEASALIMACDLMLPTGAPARGATRLKQIALNAKIRCFPTRFPHRERPDRQLLPFQSACFDPRFRTGDDGSGQEYSNNYETAPAQSRHGAGA